jgi:hypothetical protein
MNNLEIVTSQEYQELLRKLNPSMSFEPEMTEINKMIDYFKYQSNPDDEVSYIEEHLVTYEVLKNTNFFIEFKNLTLVGLYNNNFGREYFVLVEKDGSVKFLGDSIINWTNDDDLYFKRELIFEFQTACFYKYNIPTITWLDKTIRISKTTTPDDFSHDERYQNYLKSDMLYDTYSHLKETSKIGSNIKKLRLRVLGFAQSKGVFVVYINDQLERTECILDYRFFNGINPKEIKGFMDVDINYEFYENGYIDIQHYKTSKVTIFNIVGFLSGFKERFRLISYYAGFLRIFVYLFTRGKMIQIKSDLDRHK